jgi:hypothetical protein
VFHEIGQQVVNTQAGNIFSSRREENAGFAGRTPLKQFLAEMAWELKKNHYHRAGHEASLIYPD